MSEHSVVEAKSRLSEVIDRAPAGEDVAIACHGRPVVEIRPVQPAQCRVAAEDLDWLAARRTRRAAPAEDAGTLVSRTRDEDEGW